MFNVTERSYAGKVFRPKPVVYSDPSAHLVVVATPWGLRKGAEDSIQEFKKSLSANLQDNESTSPFEVLLDLSKVENAMRTATLAANFSIYNELNHDEYTCGIEFFAIYKDGHQACFVQVGSPSIILQPRQMHPSFIGSQVDLARDYARDGKLVAPLPAELLGLEPTLNIKMGSFKMQHGDSIILLSHSAPPVSIIQNSIEHIDDITRHLSEISQNTPHWVAHISIG